MHEVSVLNSIFETVESSIKDKKVKNVDKIYLSVGLLSGVSPEALLHAFSLIGKSGVFSNTEIVIQECPVSVWCQECQLETTMYKEINLVCSKCKKPISRITCGKELKVDRIEVSYET